MSNICEENIIKYYDKSLGKYVIIDRKTGFSSYQSIDEFRQQNQKLKQKQSFRQLFENKAITQLTDKNVDLMSGKNVRTEINQKLDYNNQYESPVNECPDKQLFCTQESTNIKANNRVLQEFSLTYDMKINSSVKLDKSLLSNGTLRVIGQMDCKFIVCLAVDRKLILAFDQHAVHERIRYETLLNQVYDNKRHVKTVPVRPPIDITVDCHQLEARFESYQTQIKTYTGFELKRRAVNRSHNNSYCVTQIPDCLSDSLDVESIKEIIKEAVIMFGNKTDEMNDSIALRLTPKLSERLQTKACRGAIRFNDSLKLSDCLKLIQSLSKCKSPFRCAHGRALVAPLAYLPKLQ